jgi:hypothetical protein
MPGKIPKTAQEPPTFGTTRRKSVFFLAESHIGLELGFVHDSSSSGPGLPKVGGDRRGTEIPEVQLAERD